MISYQGKKIVIIGLGVTGLSCVNYFLDKGIIPSVIDTRANPSGMDKLDVRVKIHTGSLHANILYQADLIVASPGIALSTPELVQAHNLGIEIIGDIELFCREINLHHNKKIAAITGANGKTTVTTLVGEIVQAAGLSVGIGGNIGKPVLDLLALDYDYYVLELSSFQLETTFSLRATVATILNISEDHMDRYPQGITQYVAAKQRIYLNAEHCVINADDALTHLHDQSLSTQISSFGLLTGDYHLDRDYQYLLVNDQAVMSTKQIQLLGLHNYLNILAALAIADKLMIPCEISITTIQQFKGVAHRFELVYDHRGIKWINDSKATNVGSTEAALKSIICHGTLYLLLGGDGKAANFSPLIPYLQNNNMVIYCFGKDKAQLAQLKPQASIIVATMQEAIQQLAQHVKSDDVVLLSPACASLDQFKNYEQRGEIFAQLAKEYG